MKSLYALRVRFWARFPRLSYWMGAPRTRAAMVTWILASVCGDIADGRVTRMVMYVPAFGLAFVTFRWLYGEAMHAAMCVCVTPQSPQEPEDEVPGDD